MRSRDGGIGRQLRAARVSVGYSLILTAVKFLAARQTGSVAVLSEAVNSAVDVLAAALTYAAVGFAARPPDRSHPFGHGKAQHMAALAEAVLVLGTAAWLGLRALRALLAGTGPAATAPAIAVMALTATGNVVVSRYLLRVAREHRAAALEADAVHLLTDVWSSLGVLFALLLVRVTGVPQMDGAAAIGVVGLIAAAGYRLLARALAALLDASLPEEEMRAVREAAERFPELVVEVHDLRTRQVGPRRHIDFHLVVHRRLSFEAVHDLCDRLEAEIARRLPGADVLIHPEPCDATCPRCGPRATDQSSRP